MNYRMDFSVINSLIEQFEKDYPHDEFDIYVFPQTWGSTSLGYGGIGGSAMSTAHTIVIHAQYEHIARVYFGGGRLAYQIKSPNSLFFEDMYAHRLAEKGRHGKYIREDN